jgi:hypothetical protein
MANVLLLELDWPEASRLGDITSVQYDLMTAMRYAEQWIDAERQRDYTMLDPLSLAAVTMYTLLSKVGYGRSGAKMKRLPLSARKGLSGTSTSSTLGTSTLRTPSTRWRSGERRSITATMKLGQKSSG